MYRKNMLALIALVMALAMLCGCGAQENTELESYQQQIAALQQENDALKNQVDILTGQLEALQSAVLNDWSLTAQASEDRTYATISFTAVPASVSEDQTVSLIVTLNGFEAESVQCAPDGDRYIATVQLPAADGYSYYCLLSDDSGTQQQIPLVTPDNGENDALVNLATSLNAYCNLFVETWNYAGGKLTIDSAFVQAQMPQITSGGEAATLKSAQFVFLHNGEEISRQSLTLEAGEATGSYEGSVSGVSFDVPKLEDEHQLDLQLIAELSTGETITYNGCSWYFSGGELIPIMG